MTESFQEKYSPLPNNGLRLYIDKSGLQNYNTEIFMDIALTHYPLRDYADLWNELKQTV